MVKGKQEDNAWFTIDIYTGNTAKCMDITIIPVMCRHSVGMLTGQPKKGFCARNGKSRSNGMNVFAYLHHYILKGQGKLFFI